MKDLDFDELDRAVNSLITNVPVSTNTEVVEKTLEIEPGPTEQLITSSTTAGQVATLPTSPLVARRSNGRFMDMVPPSANTRVALTMPERVSRQGTAVAPIPNMTRTPAVAVATNPVNTPPVAPTSAWPDPIDFKGPSAVSVVTDDDEDADIDQINNDITNTLNQVTEPQDSPFISGTKVEKRPLGAFSTETPVTPAQPTTLSVPETAPSQSASILPADITPVNLATPLPAELHEDLLSIEAGEAKSVTPNPTETSATVTNTPVVESQPTATVSITQQYKEQPSSGDQTTGAIYDTGDYHKALAQHPKNKSGWMWVLWIAILLVVGAGVGAAAYFLVLPKL